MDQKIFELKFSCYFNCFILVGKDNRIFLIEKNDFDLKEIVELKDIQKKIEIYF